MISTRLSVVASYLMAMMLGAAVGATVEHEFHFEPSVAFRPADPIAAAGKAYGSRLLKIYAAAWQDGARKIDGGGSVEAGIAAVSVSWQTQRAALYKATMTPILNAIVPEGTADGDITPAQRAAVAAAFRSFAAGLSE